MYLTYSPLENFKFTYTPPEKFISSHIDIHLMLCFNSSFCSFTLWLSKLVKVVFLAKITRTRTLYIYKYQPEQYTFFHRHQSKYLAVPLLYWWKQSTFEQIYQFPAGKMYIYQFSYFQTRGNILLFTYWPLGKYFAVH